ncbi:MAG TPA: division/cell wall cluster transcriptional repressor MraZ [Candidatus Eubacterium faecigallinarum]|nr:division/cell wall cluster transcriptional repressor MraZ [Candidatus Eubacterium faecigallinarum]
MDELFVNHKTHKIDAKGRISIPADMRANLGQEFIASRGFGKCLALYPMDEWNRFMKEISTINQKKRKKLEFYFSANAEKMSLDGQGRLLLNENLRRQVGLLGQKEAEVFGNNRRIEIWNCDLFYEQLNGIDEEEVEDILDEYGI